MGGTTSAEPDSTPASAQTDQFLACSDSNSDPENMSSPEDNESDCSKHDRSKDQIPENMSQNPKQDERCPEERKPLPTSPAVEVGSLSDGDVADTSPNLTGNSIQVLEDCYMGNDHCVSKPRESGLLSPPEYPCHAKCDVLLLDTLPIQTHQTSRPRNCDVKQSLSSSKLSTKFTNKDKASHVQNRLDDPLKIIAEYTAVEATYGKDESSGSVESSEKNTAGKIIRGEDSSWDLTNSYRRSRRAIDSGDVSNLFEIPSYARKRTQAMSSPPLSSSGDTGRASPIPRSSGSRDFKKHGADSYITRTARKTTGLTSTETQLCQASNEKSIRRSKSCRVSGNDRPFYDKQAWSSKPIEYRWKDFADVKQSLSSPKSSSKFTNEVKASPVQTVLNDSSKMTAEYTAVATTYNKDKSSDSSQSSKKITMGNVTRCEDSSWDHTNLYRRLREANGGVDVSNPCKKSSYERKRVEAKSPPSLSSSGATDRASPNPRSSDSKDSKKHGADTYVTRTVRMATGFTSTESQLYQASNEKSFRRSNSCRVSGNDRPLFVKQAWPNKPTESRWKNFPDTNRPHEDMHNFHQQDSAVIRIHLQRFSEQSVKSKAFRKASKIKDILGTLETHDSSVQTHLYQKHKQLQADSLLEDEIEVTDTVTHIYVCVSPTERRLQAELVTDKPDMINPWDDDPRYLMPCGHAITPDSLYAYCWSELQNRKNKLKCPAIKEGSITKCGTTWEFVDVVRGACLSDDEMNLFCSFLNHNWLANAERIQLCPVCGEAIKKSKCGNTRMKCIYCRNLGRTGTFCFVCLQPWRTGSRKDYCGNRSCKGSVENMLSVLENCQRKSIVGVRGCPVVRACPGCRFVLEHTSSGEDGCKHMVCTSCNTKFCFICLKIKTDELYWPCGGAFEQCQVAPIQKLTL